MKMWILYITAFLLLLGCSGSKERDFGPKWPKDNPAADSLTLVVELELMSRENPETIRKQLRELEMLSSPKSAGKLQFLKIRLLRNSQEDDAPVRMLDKLQATLDSAEQPYLWARIQGERCNLTHKDITSHYRVFHRNLQYFSSLGDSLMVMTQLNYLCGLYHELQQDEIALQCLDEADAIARKMGIESYTKGCMIMRAAILANSGQTARADSIYRLMLADPYFRRNLLVYEVVLRNRYLDCNHFQSLMEANRLSNDNEELRHLRALHSSLLSDAYFDRGQLDSGKYYGHRALANYSSVFEPNQIYHILGNYALVMELEGKKDSALYYTKMRDAMFDSIGVFNSIRHVSKEDMRRQIGIFEDQLRRQREHERMLRIVTVLALVAVGSMFAFFMYRRSQKVKFEKMKAELELERSRRSVAARALAMEEKDNLLKETRRMLASLSGSEAARELENMIKMHSAGSQEWENFDLLFEKVRPDFTRILRERHPDLQENDLKLCMYIYVGLSNAQIARMLIIRPESVRQARWRMRKRMQLPPDTSIEDYLRTLSS